MFKVIGGGLVYGLAFVGLAYSLRKFRELQELAAQARQNNK